jgi:GTP-binding protein LepA
MAYIRVFDGRVDARQRLRLMQTGSRFEPVELGYFTPTMSQTPLLEAGEVGYVATGL